MKKKFVQVAIFSLVATGAASMLVSCENDDWKTPVEEVESNNAEISKTLGLIDQTIKELDTKISENKAAAEAAAKAAADAMKAAGDAADEALAAAKAAEAASKLAEEAAAKAQQAAAEELKAAYEELKNLISQNADAIALNKALIDGNTDKINANSTKIEGNTQAIERILAQLADYAKSSDVEEKYQGLADKLAAAGVDITDLKSNLDGLQNSVAGLQISLETLLTATENLGIQMSGLEAALRSEMGTLEQNLAAQIAGEAALREQGDADLQNQIDQLTSQLAALNLATNLDQFTSFISQTRTQLAALETFKASMEGDFSNLANKVDGIQGIVDKNVQDIAALAADLANVESMAQTNAAAIAAQLALIEKNATDISDLNTKINAITADIDDLKTFKEDVTNEIVGINERIDIISERLNSLQPLLNTMILDQLRGLVFVPEAYVGGIESALSYRMLYKPLTLVPNTPEVKTIGNFKVKQAKIWNQYVAANTADAIFNPQTVVSYHMNPKSAVVSFQDLSIVSNDAEILSRAARASITLDDTYNGGAGMSLNDGVLSVAIKGDASVYDDTNVMPVFALQAEVQGKEDEEGNYVKNTVTSDYAMFVQMNVRPEAIQYNKEKYTSTFGAAATANMTEVKTSQKVADVLNAGTETKVAWNGSVDLLSVIEIAYKDIQRNEEKEWTSSEQWGKFGLDVEFMLVDYTIGNSEISESSWASVDPETGVLTACVNGDTSKQSTDALGHMPLVYITAKHDGKIVLDGFIRVKIAPSVAYYKTAVAEFDNISFGCDQTYRQQVEGFNVINEMCAATGLSKDVLLSIYKPVGPVYDPNTGDITPYKQFTYDTANKRWVAASNPIGFILPTDIVAGDIVEYNLTWAFDTDDQQVAYEAANHTATTYVCFDSGKEEHPAIYIPLKIAVDEKPVGTVGDKLLVRWFRDGDNTALLNVPVPSSNNKVTNISTELDQLWQNATPQFKGLNDVAGYKYYFTAANNRTYEGVTYTVENSTNPCLIDNKKVSNANMGDHALLTNRNASEYNNTVLKANGEVLATINNTTGVISLANNATALGLLNKFNSMGGEDRPDAKLEALVGIVPYSSCDIAFKVDNPEFTTAFLRPINVYEGQTVTFTDADIRNGSKPIYGMLKFTDWRGQDFAGNEWLYGYYNVKSIVPDFSRMTTNAGDGGVGNNFKVDTSIIPAFGHTAGSVIYTAYVYPDGSSAIKSFLNTAFGTITYDNTKLNIKEFDVMIPFKVTYELGEFEVWVKCHVNATIQ